MREQLKAFKKLFKNPFSVDYKLQKKDLDQYIPTASFSVYTEKELQEAGIDVNNEAHKLTPEQVAELECWKFSFDNKEWELGNYVTRTGIRMLNYFPKGTGHISWDKLVSSESFSDSDIAAMSPYQYMVVLITSVRSKGFNCKYEVLSRNEKNILLEYQIVDSMLENCHFIHRIYKPARTLYCLHYASKEPSPIPLEVKEQWINRLQEATVKAND